MCLWGQEFTVAGSFGGSRVDGCFFPFRVLSNIGFEVVAMSV